MKLIWTILIFILLLGCNSKYNLEDQFFKITGLEIIENIELVNEYENYVFNGDGEYAVIFKTTDDQINRWLSNSPPWSLDMWKRGPVEHEIGFHCSFGHTDGNVSVTKVNDSTFYSGNEKIINILSNNYNYYSFEERCCSDKYSDLKFHNGSLLIINPNNNTVYLSVWEM